MKRDFVMNGRCRLSSCFYTVLKNGRAAAFLSVLLVAAHVVAAVTAELSLEDAIERAQEYSHAVKSARYDSAAADLVRISAERDRFPVLSFSAQSFYVDEVQAIDLPFSERQIGSKDNYQTDVKVSVPLYTGGRLSSRIDIRERQSLAAAMRLAAERMSVAYRARRAYLGVLNAWALVRATEASLTRVGVIRQHVMNLHDNGMADSLDLLEAEFAVETAQRQVDRVDTELKNAQVSLARLMGTDSIAVADLSEEIPIPDTSKCRALSIIPAPNRPELKRMDYLIDAADHATNAEMGKYLPVLNGYIGYSYGMPNRDWFEQTWNDYWTAGLIMTWELNLGLKTSKDVSAARQRAASARMARQNIYDDLATQRDVAVNAVRHAYEIYEITKAEYDLSRRRFDLARLQQEAGRISVNRLLELEAELASAEQGYRASVYAYYLAECDLLYAIGSSRIFGGLR
jgi:outer membrane protein TolC